MRISFLPSSFSSAVKTIKETTSRLFPTSYSLLPTDSKCWRFSAKMQNICGKRFSLLKIFCHFLWNWVPITVVWWFENNETNFSLRSKSHLIYFSLQGWYISNPENLIFLSWRYFEVVWKAIKYIGGRYDSFLWLMI